MKLLKLKRILKFFTDIKFAIFLLILIAISSSLGSIIEQDESFNFYKEKYPIAKPIFGYISSNLILDFGLDHIYRTEWFLGLLLLFGTCLISCTATHQLPKFLNSKKYFFKQKEKSFTDLPFFVKFPTKYYTKEKITLNIHKKNTYLYQNQKYLYGYKGLIGRISPILVHISLIILLVGSAIGAFINFKAQEMLPKGELFHIQNPIRVGQFARVPIQNYRVNDFWVEYKRKKISQFYSNVSILDNFGNELKQQTISVNNPMRYNGIDVYQSDWNLLGIRIKTIPLNEIKEIPLFPLEKDLKLWLTCVNSLGKTYILVFDQLRNIFLVYNHKGLFIGTNNIGDVICEGILIKEILPSTGLLIKYDPSIPWMYFGFGLLMVTASLSYLPYVQIWASNQNYATFVGSSTNRGKVEMEIEFESLIRSIQQKLQAKI